MEKRRRERRKELTTEINVKLHTGLHTGKLFKIQILKFKFEHMFSILEVLQMLEGKLDFLHLTHKKKMHKECTGQGKE